MGMRFVSLYLKHYKRIYSGLQLDEIYIDFTKCKHKILLIKGDNGSGKTTIYEALVPFPEPNNCFIDGKEAVKKISYIDTNDGTIYTVVYIHPIKVNGERDTGKGYITKICNGVETQLNPSGNISTCKEIVFNEFKLDANYIALSQLSATNKGIAEKRPADRKKFMSRVISKVEVYEAIYKAISKRSSIFKSMINNISSKIASIGDEATLNGLYNNITQSLESLTNQKNIEIENIANARGYIKTVDPDGSIQDNYHKISDRIAELNVSYKELNSAIMTRLNSLHLDSNIDIVESINSLILLQNSLNLDISYLTDKSTSILTDIEVESVQLQNKTLKLNNITDNINFEATKNMIKDTKAEIERCENVFSIIGIDKSTLLTKDEYISGIDMMEELKYQIDIFKESFSYDIIQDTINNYFIPSKNPQYDDLIAEQNNIISQIGKYEEDRIRNESLLSLLKPLSLRPKNCKINECSFIADALNAKKQDPEKKLKIIDEFLVSAKARLREINDMIEYYKSISNCLNSLRSLMRMIQVTSTKNFVKKLPILDSFSDPKIFIKRLINNDVFKEIDTLYSYMQYANVFEEYRVAKETMYKLEADYKVYLSESQVIDEINADITVLNNKIECLSKTLENNREQIKENKLKLIDIDKQVKSLLILNDSRKKLENITVEINALKSDKDKLESKIATINQSIKVINDATNRLQSIESSMNELMEKKDSISYNLKRLNDYKKEYKEFKAKYDKIETIKYYSSSTTGIQLVFIELYMISTISLANKLLSFLFNGKYSLMRPKIDEEEFSIPCIDINGLIHDDISNMSGAEVACLSMIVSFALLNQASSKLNIIKLDEVDASLDSSNRRNFILVINEIMDILECEQCVIISHNNEFSVSDCDVIVLKDSGLDEIMGNVIYRYTA